MNDLMRMITVNTDRAKSLKREATLHLTIWSVYAFAELFVVYSYGRKLEPAYVYLTYYTINIFLFYGSLWVLHRPSGRSTTGWLRKLTSWAVLVTSYVILKTFANTLFYGAQGTFGNFRTAGDSAQYLITTLFRGAIFVLPAVFYWLAGDLDRTKREALETEVKLAGARNAYLRQQLNPHLLFNTLNFVYSQVFRRSAEGARAVELLTEILRYTIREGGSDEPVDIELEVAQIGNLIEIDRSRFGGDRALETDIRIETPGQQIIPLILLTLTENIFKHGDLRDIRQPALLAIRTDMQGVLKYHTRNLKKDRHQEPHRQGIGLANIRSRLDLAYPRRYELNIMETEHIFELDLTMQLWNSPAT